MTLPLIAATLGGIILVLQQVLMLSAGLHRGKTRKGVGHDGDVELERKVRRHGNLAENSGIFIVIIALLELTGGASGIITALAATFLLARILHAIGFGTLAGSHGGEYAKASGGRTPTLLRAAGATLTALSGIVAGAYLLVVALPQL